MLTYPAPNGSYVPLSEVMSTADYAPTIHRGELTKHETIETLAGAWLASKPSPRTRAAYLDDLNRFHRWVTLNRLGTVLTVKRAHLDAYARSLEAASPPYAPASRARMLSSLSSFYGYLCAEGVLQVNPAATIRRPRLPNYSPRLGLDLSSAPLVLEAAKRLTAEHRGLVALCFFAGLRISEALGVRGSDIRTEAGHTVVKVLSKGGSEDLVPLSAPALRFLEELREKAGEGALFGDLDRFAARRLVIQLGREAGLGRELTSHDLRHGAATCAREAGVPLEEVRDLLRHASITTTQRYDHARRRLDDSAAYGLARALGGQV